MHLYNLGKLCFFIDKIKNKTLYFIPIKQNHYNHLQSRFQLTNYNNSRCVYQLSHSIFLFLDHKVAAFGVRVRDYKSNLAGKKLGLCSNEGFGYDAYTRIFRVPIGSTYLTGQCMHGKVYMHRLLLQ